MYARPTDRVDDRGIALEILDAAAFVHLVSVGSSGFDVTGLPMIFDEATDRLFGHVARANRHWRELDEKPVVVIAVASDAYISPSWYRSKLDDGGRVVPTWNYEAVHVHGEARIHDDPDWTSAMVEALTDKHESRRTDGADRWAVSDAPHEFVEQQLRAIVGVSVSIDRIEAKQKLGANRSVLDQAGVVEGLTGTAGSPSRMIDAMTSALGTEPASGGPA